MIKVVLNILIFIFFIVFYILYSIIGLGTLIVLRTLLVWNKNIETKLTKFVKIHWLDATMAFLGFYFPKPIFIGYDTKILNKKKTIIISNHQTNYDWLFIITVLHSLGKYEDIFIILKESLAKVPIYGYGMKVFGYIFLKRKWHEDRETLVNGLKMLRSRDSYNLLLFPEGTLIDSQTHAKSKVFSETNNILFEGKPFNPEEVLIPRKRGFSVIYDILKDEIDGIIDITILFNPYEKYPQDKSSLWDVFITRKAIVDFIFTISFIKNSPEIAKEDFLYDIFSKKENLILKYKERKEEIKSLENIENIHDIWYGKKGNYKYGKVFVWSNVSQILLTGYCFLFGILVLRFIESFFNFEIVP
ncbi:hypothetical protein TCON_0687 [Astathelohania contejeani]|uniref:Phospholipid/glycerol acyltransferase domain-containing protein n=1 Tax=Astathelohania contejeani TaxID=164912 RepID=A0ABQ7I109_9MICR|nr:hypothetical protein TCON_0687 [Thelohania contejeani]